MLWAAALSHAPTQRRTAIVRCSVRQSSAPDICGGRDNEESDSESATELPVSEALAAGPLSDNERISSVFEFWPSWFFYTPVVLYWIALGVLHRNLMLPTAANPHIETGGLCGESKSKILEQVGRQQRGWIARHYVINTERDSFEDVVSLLSRENMPLPIVVKPDIGCHGTGVCLVETMDRLQEVLASFPRKVDLLLQEYISFTEEAGVFYVRMPGSEARITSLTLKHSPAIRGDGRSTVRELMEADARIRETKHLFYPRLQDRLDKILPFGESVRLVFTGNHCKGSIFRNGEPVITPALTRRIDEICRSMRDFHFGRLDLRFDDTSALRRGEGFRVIEVNGVGSEATHIWDPQTTLKEAYRSQFAHFRKAFEIGGMMRERGHHPSSLAEFLKMWRRQTRLMASYPAGD